MDWGKIVVRSIVSSIIITLSLGLLQLLVTLAGVGWFALLPPHALGKSFWGLPYGWLSQIVYPNAPYMIESAYLLYDIVIWFVISLVVIALRRK